MKPNRWMRMTRADNYRLHLLANGIEITLPQAANRVEMSDALTAARARRVAA